jgi:hypothetical protein
VFLEPGDDHPNAPCPPAEIASRLRVAGSDLAAWLAEGCPVQPDGRLDPYAVSNWLSWGRLERCPVLARRWSAWLRWFTTTGRPCRILVQRAQTCMLPVPRALHWQVPEPGDAPGQRVLARQWDEGEPGECCRLLERASAREHRWTAEDELALEPQTAEPRDRATFERLVDGLAGEFIYAYRRHRPGDPVATTGTCLDLARLCGEALTRMGRPWRLVSGVVAHRGLANAHFWVEADDGPAGWIPLDPTIPAVARMLGADWRAAVPLAVGRHDARRIRVAAATGPVGDDLGGIGGRLDADGDDALYCTDWAIGECGWSIAAA